MGELYQRMDADLRLRNRSPKTRKEYLDAASAFVRHFMRSPAEMGEAEVLSYLRELATKGAGPAKLRMAVAAIKFLYRATLLRPEVVANVPWPKARKTLPKPVSLAEIVTALTALRHLRHRMLLVTAYDAGLRIHEAARLRSDDILTQRGLIHVLGKGNKERWVPLPAAFAQVFGFWLKDRPRGEAVFAKADGKPIYEAKDLRVGLFDAKDLV